MSLDYRLTLATGLTAAQIAERALLPVEAVSWGDGRALGANLSGTLGVDVTLRSARHGYVDADTDGEPLEWEPGPFVAITFGLGGSVRSGQAAANMIAVVRRVLETGPEDAALVVNGDYLLVARFGGHLVKHNHARWWSAHPAADAVIGG
ncbi:SitI3 family protein [Actinoplanes couchii]|uniref:Uncharacterized protein n=1 Tax=Actinoplanes couchii TaxID=403638 RepID=A0ABQ3X8X2_9ACTN|nr:SitI3 family protein [Actinoplanes couchii]MDR6325888.1 hypothetical protein [Actinoplanes couchii]GID54942.1 hypothetical protein Aco03nite_033460 [Actinoplanes couchii]